MVAIHLKGTSFILDKDNLHWKCSLRALRTLNARERDGGEIPIDLL